MNRLIISSRLAVLFLVIILSISLNDRANASGQIKSGSKTVPQVMEPGLLKVTPAQEAIEQAREDNINKLMRTGSEDLMVGDYPAATLVYRKLEHMNTTNIDYKENLAYALLGMNQKVQALQECTTHSITRITLCIHPVETAEHTLPMHYWRMRQATGRKPYWLINWQVRTYRLMVRS